MGAFRALFRSRAYGAFRNGLPELSGQLSPLDEREPRMWEWAAIVAGSLFTSARVRPTIKIVVFVIIVGIILQYALPRIMAP
jgi:hypothetical protein